VAGLAGQCKEYTALGFSEKRKWARRAAAILVAQAGTAELG